MNLERKTIFSPCRCYRYTLWREWATPSGLPLGGLNPISLRGSSEFVQFIGLNPSAADEFRDDPTIRRCTGFAKAWGFKGMCMTNLFAFRATNPKEMKKQKEHPMGPDNFNWLLNISNKASLIVVAWGNGGTWMGQQNIVLEMLADHKLFALGVNSNGTPKHPLYLKENSIPVVYEKRTDHACSSGATQSRA